MERAAFAHPAGVVAGATAWDVHHNRAVRPGGRSAAVGERSWRSPWTSA